VLPPPPPQAPPVPTPIAASPLETPSPPQRADSTGSEDSFDAILATFGDEDDDEPAAAAAAEARLPPPAASAPLPAAAAAVPPVQQSARIRAVQAQYARATTSAHRDLAAAERAAGTVASERHHREPRPSAAAADAMRTYARKRRR